MSTAERTAAVRSDAAGERWQVTAPVSLLAELTHRCPLQCPYCSNPLALDKAGVELDTATWQRVLEEAAELGVLQVAFSGGEPTLRRDLESLIAHAAALGLYSNLITAGVLLDEARLHALIDAGLDHLQLSVQDAEPGNADRIGGYRGGHAKKLRIAELVRKAGIPLTINAVVHRQNVDNLEAIIELAVACGAKRLEVAHVQYYGWALVNRAALMPTREQTERSVARIEAAKERLKGVLAFDYVIPDYYARYPKPCMGGWAKQNLERHALGQGPAVPCGGDHHHARVRQRQGSLAQRDLVRGQGIQRVSRHCVDGRAVPQLSTQDRGFRRLPLPGVRADRRCHGDRPGVLALPSAPGSGGDR